MNATAAHQVKHGVGGDIAIIAHRVARETREGANGKFNRALVFVDPNSIVLVAVSLASAEEWRFNLENVERLNAREAGLWVISENLIELTVSHDRLSG